MTSMQVAIGMIPEPVRDCAAAPTALTDQTISERVEKVLARMGELKLDQLVIYCDVEHAGNFTYLAGFFTRFEEGLLVVDASGSMCFVLGNENFNKAGKARLDARAVLAPVFSLPNQPDTVRKPLAELLREAGIEQGARVGLAGWKLFAAAGEAPDGAGERFDVPAFIVEALRAAAGEGGTVVNAMNVFIGPGGVRTTNNANEIAHYEFGAALASDGMLDALDAVMPGVSEMDLGDKLARRGRHTNVVTIAASGPRFVGANMFPSENTVKWGDPVSLTVGYAGGLSSRAAYAVSTADELPAGQRDWFERVVAPYYTAYARWLETVHVGMTGGELFALVDRLLPRAEFGWSLCPGHLVADEEWLCSPVYEGSRERIASGMLFQIDIIPAVPGYAGVSAESTVAVADAALQREIETWYPTLWSRIQARRAYIEGTLGIRLSGEVLPMCSTVGYLRPYLLNHRKACYVVRT